MKALLTLMVCALWLMCSLAFGEVPLAEELINADIEYRLLLSDLAIRARKAGDIALAKQAERRLEIASTFPAPPSCPKERTLEVTGTMKGYAELVVGPDGLTWRDPARFAGPADLAVNKVPWAFNWAEGHEDNILEIPVREIVRWRGTGSGVVIVRIPRGVGAVGFKITCRNVSERENFTLKLQYR